MKMTLSAGRAKALLAVAAMVVGTSALAITAASPAYAETLTVTSNADSGPGTLREAVTRANTNGTPDTITFALPRGQRTIALSSQITFSVLQETTVDGTGQGVTVSGRNVTRVFDTLPTATVTVKNLTVVNGRVNDFGGGIRNLGTLTVAGSTFSGSRAGFGAGIYNNGILTVTGSTFSGNAAVASLAANGFGGGIDNRGVTKVSGSTFSGNSADRNGGGFRNGNIAEITDSTFSRNNAGLLGGGLANNGVTMTVVSSTISQNGARISGGGVSSLESPGTATLRSTRVTNNRPGGDCAQVAGVSGINDGGNNTSSDRTCGFR